MRQRIVLMVLCLKVNGCSVSLMPLFVVIGVFENSMTWLRDRVVEQSLVNQLGGRCMKVSFEQRYRRGFQRMGFHIGMRGRD